MKRLLLPLLCLGLWSCEHALEEMEVENGYAPANASFAFKTPLTSSSTYADFANETVQFSSEFNQPVSWTLTITGVTSGAEKTFDGASSSIDETAIWDGASDNVYFFREDEDYIAELTVLGSETSSLIVDSIQSEKVFDAVLMGDFEVGSPALVSPSSWWTASDPNEAYIIGKQSDHIKAVQGESYMSLGGTDFNSNYYVAIVGHSPVDPNLSGDPASVYLNLYINSNGNPSTNLDVVVQDVDGDMFSTAVDVTWTGWKLYSVPLSNMSINPTFSTGDGLMDLETINQVSFTLLTGSEPGPANNKEVNLDMISFTYDRPFDQKY